MRAAATATPPTLNLGNVTVHNTSTAKVVTLINNQNTPIGIISITIGGTNPGDFAKTTTCGASIPAFGYCTVSAVARRLAPGSLPDGRRDRGFLEGAGRSAERAVGKPLDIAQEPLVRKYDQWQRAIA